jgi:hypothetical protein
MSETWHAEPGDIARYAAGAIDDTGAGSIEAHLVTCAHCRAQVAQVADTGRLDASWLAIVDTLDRPRPTVVERVARGLGVRNDTARVLAATPSLQRSWLLAVVVAFGFAVLAAQGGTDRGLALFLVLAPLIPVAGVAGGRVVPQLTDRPRPGDGRAGRRQPRSRHPNQKETTMMDALRQGWWAPVAAVLAVCNGWIGVWIMSTDQNVGSIVGGSLFLLGGIAILAGLVMRPGNRRLGTGLIVVGALWGLPLFWTVVPPVLALLVIAGVLTSPAPRTSSAS